MTVDTYFGRRNKEIKEFFIKILTGKYVEGG